MAFGKRMCNFTSRPIEAKDRASVQLFVAKLDSNGRVTGEKEVLDICGSLRVSGEIDSLLYEYSRKN